VKAQVTVADAEVVVAVVVAVSAQPKVNASASTLKVVQWRPKPDNKPR